MDKKPIEVGTLILIRYLDTFGIVTEFLGLKRHKNVYDPSRFAPKTYQNAVYIIDCKAGKNKQIEDKGQMIHELLRLSDDEMKDYLDGNKNIDQIVHDHQTEILGKMGAAVFFRPIS